MLTKLFSEFISIQSVSTDSSRYSEILKAVEFLKKEIKTLGFKVKTYQKGNCPPLIVGTYKPSFTKASEGKAIGVYAHYDVQPEDPVNKWKSPPFDLTLRNGKFYGRGTADDKGHIIQVIAAIDRLIKTKKLKNNIVLVLEGEEEIGSPNFQALINKGKNELAEIDVFYMLDFGQETSNQPEIFFGLRGLIAFELTVITGKKDLHSGVYGNRVHNPINVLTSLLSKIKDSETGKILIPGFYKNVRKPRPKEMDNLLAKKQTDQELKKEAEVFSSVTQDKKYPWLSTKIYPSFDINGISGGYTEEGVKTVISHTATAKFSFRLIENQTPNEIEKPVEKFIKSNLPKGVRYNLKVLGKLEPFYNDIENIFVKKTSEIFTSFFGVSPIFTRTGGSIGAAATLNKTFGKPLVLTGFTLADCNLHSPNENYDEEMFYKGIKVLERIFAQ